MSDEFPGNSHVSKRAPEPAEDEKRVERVVQGEVIRRKPPLSRRAKQFFLGDDPKETVRRSMHESVFPGIRDLVYDSAVALLGDVVLRDGGGRFRRSRSGLGQHIVGNTAYNVISSMREDPRRGPSNQARALHNFDEIVIPSRIEAEEILDRLIGYIERYEQVTVADFYDMAGAGSTHTDRAHGWVDLSTARVARVGSIGYRLDLPKPEPLGK